MRGFTTVRDVGGPVFGLKAAIDEGLIAGPRIWPSGAVITVTRGTRRLPPVVGAAADDRRHAQSHGADWRQHGR